MLKQTRKTTLIRYGGLLLVLSAVALVGAGACKKESHTAGKEARETFERSKELLKDSLGKTKDITKDGLQKGGEVARESIEKSQEAAKEFSKGWKEGGK